MATGLRLPPVMLVVILWIAHYFFSDPATGDLDHQGAVCIDVSVDRCSCTSIAGPDLYAYMYVPIYIYRVSVCVCVLPQGQSGIRPLKWFVRFLLQQADPRGPHV